MIERIILTALEFTIFSVFYVEFLGYFWHRWVEHGGFLGNFIQYRHFIHHEIDYPTSRLRPSGKYKAAKAWSWYILFLIGLVILVYFLPLFDFFVMAAGSTLYATLIVSRFHDLYHVRKSFFHKFKWMKRLIKLHDVHHYGPYNYGIVFFWFDKLFGTFKKEFPEKEILDFPKNFVKNKNARTYKNQSANSPVLIR